MTSWPQPEGRGRKKRLGSRRPQVRSVPPFASSAGDEAIRLAATAGLVLDGWQADFLKDSLGETAGGRWSSFENGLVVGRQNGKGSVLEARVLAGLLLFGEKLILWSAHEMKTTFEAFRRCEELFTTDPELKKLVKSVTKGNGKECIELRNGARLKFVARSSGSGRGFSTDVMILDEAYALTDDHMAAMIPTLATRPNPQIYYTSTPPLDGASGSSLYRLRERAQKGDRNLCWYDWGLQGVDLDDRDEVDLDDRKLWATCNPGLGMRGQFDENFVEKERGALTDEGFARERLGIWPRQLAAGSGVIDLKLWGELAERAARPDDIAIAVDINPARTRAAIVAVGARSAYDSTMQIGVLAYGPGLDWVPAKLAELKAEFNPVAIGLDVKGPAASLLLDLERLGITPPVKADEPARGDLAIPNPADVATAFGLFVDAARQRLLRHSDDNVLNLALAAAKTRALVGGSAWDRKGGTDISPLVAATLAYWAYVTRIEAIRTSYDPLANIW